MSKYIRTKNGRIIDIDEKYSSFIKVSYRIMNISKENYIKRLHLNIVKQADTIRGLIMKGDLIFYKDQYSGLNAREDFSIAYDDIDKCSQYFEKEITKIFFKDVNGNFIKVAELDNRHNLEMVSGR